MKIVIDARMLRRTGVGLYTRKLLEHLQQIDHINQYIVLLVAKDYDFWNPTAANFCKRRVDIEPYSLAEQLLLPWVLYRLRADLVHFTHLSAPCLYLRKRIITIHDMTMIQYKTNRGNGLVERLRYAIKHWGMRFVIRCDVMRSAALITDTEWVKRDILNYYHSSVMLDKIKAKTVAIHLAVSAPSLRQSKKADKPFLLYVGNFYIHKNIPRLLEALKLLLVDNPDLELVLVGSNDYFLEQIKNRAKELGVAGSITTPGFISDEELADLYQKAEVFVFPSLAEGFGLPPLEAMARGTAVISSNATCLPEVLGTAAAYFDPKSAADMADKIGKLLDDPKELERLRKAGPEQVKRFSWGRTAEQTLAVYRQALRSME